MAKKEKKLKKIVLTISNKYDKELVEDCMLIVNGVAFVHAIQEETKKEDPPNPNDNQN